MRVRSTIRAAANARSSVLTADSLRDVWLQLRDVGQEFLLISPAYQVIADHFVRPQGRLASCGQTDQHTGDDRAVGLNLNALGVVTQEMPASQDMLEEAKKELDRVTVKVEQGDDFCRHIQ